MARIECEIAAETRANDDDIDVDGVTATCSKCDHETFSFGTDSPSVRRCLALMREECPRGEANFYVGDADEV